MALSKEYLLSSKKLPSENGILRENNQYKNLNLNQNRKFENLKTVQSGLVLSKIGKGFVNSERCDLLTRNDDSWKNNDICEKFGNLNLRNSDQFMPKRNSIHSTETFAINIKTYESFGDTRIYDGEFEGGRNGILQKKCGKFSFMNFVGRITNAFEFPRQQENGGSEPEIMQFRASQHLDRSRSTTFGEEGARAEQRRLGPLVAAADVISGSMSRFNGFTFMRQLDKRYEQLGLLPLSVHKAWRACVANVKRRHRESQRYPDIAAVWKDFDEKIIAIEQRHDPYFPHNAPRKNRQQLEDGNIDRTVSPPQSRTMNNDATTNPPSADQPSETVTTESHHKRRRSSSSQSISTTNKRPMINVNGARGLMLQDRQLGSLASSVANERRQAFHGEREQFVQFGLRSISPQASESLYQQSDDVSTMQSPQQLQQNYVLQQLAHHQLNAEGGAHDATGRNQNNVNVQQSSSILQPQSSEQRHQRNIPPQQTSQPILPPLPAALPAANLSGTGNPNSAVMERMLCAQINANDIATTAIFQGFRHADESMEATFMAQTQSNAAIIQSIVRIFGNKK